MGVWIRNPPTLLGTTSRRSVLRADGRCPRSPSWRLLLKDGVAASPGAASSHRTSNRMNGSHGRAGRTGRSWLGAVLAAPGIVRRPGAGHGPGLPHEPRPPTGRGDGRPRRGGEPPRSPPSRGPGGLLDHWSTEGARPGGAGHPDRRHGHPAGRRDARAGHPDGGQPRDQPALRLPAAAALLPDAPGARRAPGRPTSRPRPRKPWRPPRRSWPRSPRPSPRRSSRALAMIGAVAWRRRAGPPSSLTLEASPGPRSRPGISARVPSPVGPARIGR